MRAAYESEYSQFVVVYGRRRVGKTFLVRETFNYTFTFEHSGMANTPRGIQLQAWRQSLNEAGYECKQTPTNWMEAFGLLRELIKASNEKKKVVFVDELPWLDTRSSGFVPALEFFWNSWASARKDVLLIVCGSATSWIINEVFRNHGGLHNRVTQQIYLAPFTLNECEQLAQSQHLRMTRYDILEAYMVMGGVPYYWSLLKKEKSLAGNIDELFFAPHGHLRHEFNELYNSLFKNADRYISIVRALGQRQSGMTRDELIDATGLQSNGNLTRMLEELEQCAFIRRYNIFNHPGRKRDAVFQLIDNYTLFYLKFIQHNKQNDEHYWTNTYRTSQRYAWAGLAFERVCFQHIRQVKQALGISNVVTNEMSYRLSGDGETAGGLQIDMLIDRADNVINLCEMKFASQAFTIDKSYNEALRNKISRFQQVTRTRKAIHLTMVTTCGVTHNAYWNQVQSEVTADQLFAP